MSTIKVLAGVIPKSGLSDEEFHDHWRHPHASFGTQIATTRGYAQNHRIAFDSMDSRQAQFEGVAEAWYDSVEDALELPKNRYYVRDLIEDELMFINPEQTKLLICDEEVVLNGPDPNASVSVADSLWRFDHRPTSIKLLLFGLSPPAHFIELSAQAELGARLGALRYVYSRPLSMVHGESPPFYGVHEFWWPTLTALKRGISNERTTWGQLMSTSKDVVPMLAQHERYW